MTRLLVIVAVALALALAWGAHVLSKPVELVELPDRTRPAQCWTMRGIGTKTSLANIDAAAGRELEGRVEIRVCGEDVVITLHDGKTDEPLGTIHMWRGLHSVTRIYKNGKEYGEPVVEHY